jgi:hypothetical protein
MIAVQTVRDILGGLLVACSSYGLAGVGDDFALVATNRKISGFNGFVLDIAISSLPRSETDWS